MDDSPAPEVRKGGTVEPANRATVAKDRFQTPADTPGERYELRDPFAEVTYRVKTFAEMVAKADQLGAIRFHAVAADGKRTPVEKVGGAWRRADTREVAAPPVAREDAQRATGAALPAETVVPPEVVIAKIDAEAERAARARQLETALSERYIIKRAAFGLGAGTLGQTEYRYRGDTSRVAFTESTFKLSTDNNNPSVARSMVDVAEARNWRTLRVSGNEDFKRLVWLEASLRGVKTLGYEPQQADQELLRREREARSVNRIEPVLATREASADATAAKQSARGGGGRKAVLAALEAVLVAKRVPEKQRDAVMAAAADNLAQRLREGQTIKVKVFDKSAPSQRPVVVPTPEVQRARERAAPVR